MFGGGYRVGIADQNGVLTCRLDSSHPHWVEYEKSKLGISLHGPQSVCAVAILIAGDESNIGRQVQVRIVAVLVVNF